MGYIISSERHMGSINTEFKKTKTYLHEKIPSHQRKGRPGNLTSEYVISTHISLKVSAMPSTSISPVMFS
jgi:hypothetical protein